jgi:hypothetical protein
MMEHITLSTLATETGKDPRTLQRWVHRFNLPVQRDGRGWAIPPSTADALREYIATGEAPRSCYIVADVVEATGKAASTISQRLDQMGLPYTRGARAQKEFSREVYDTLVADVENWGDRREAKPTPWHKMADNPGVARVLEIRRRCGLS